ncbi:MAG: hypothetical protein WD025_08595 [Bacteriovoracaceae bacterium]
MKKLLVLFIISFSTYGSVLFEPYVGMTFSGDVEESGEDGVFEGPGYGVKLGAQYQGLYGGFDYRLGSYTLDMDGDASKLEDKTLSSEIYYAFVGYEFPAFFKVWAGLGIGGRANSNEFEFTEGSGSLIGVGYKGLRLVSLNFEFNNWKYGKVDPGGDSDLEGSNFLFSVSVPINF